MSESDRQRVFENLRSWIGKANPALRLERLDPDTDILAGKILESLQMVEFVLFLERETGRTILAENLDPNALRTLNKVYDTFFVPFR